MVEYLLYEMSALVSEAVRMTKVPLRLLFETLKFSMLFRSFSG